MSRSILITGGTGKQGGATIQALLNEPDALKDITILAVTRDANSNGAKKLAAKSGKIKLVQGDMSDVPALFAKAKEQHSNIWGVFSVQVPGAQEEMQGKAMVDEAIKNNVKLFVFSSVERGGTERSWENPTDIPHFISKHNIELHLREKASKAGMDYTILRPVAFMENWTPGFQGKVFGAAWNAALPQDRKLQLVHTGDIGFFGGQAFLHPDTHRNKAVGIAGDELTWEEADKIFNDVVGYGAPATFTAVGYIFNFAMKELGNMFRWFNNEGYGVNIEEARKENPNMLDLRKWLETKSGYAKGGSSGWFW